MSRNPAVLIRSLPTGRAQDLASERDAVAIPPSCSGHFDTWRGIIYVALFPASQSRRTVPVTSDSSSAYGPEAAFHALGSQSRRTDPVTSDLKAKGGLPFGIPKTSQSRRTDYLSGHSRLCSGNPYCPYQKSQSRRPAPVTSDLLPHRADDPPLPHVAIPPY